MNVDKMLKQQFINGMNDYDMMTEIVREVAAIKKTKDITSEQILHWAKSFHTKSQESDTRSSKRMQ